jgi:hypothetical protein
MNSSATTRCMEKEGQSENRKWVGGIIGFDAAGS